MEVETEIDLKSGDSISLSNSNTLTTSMHLEVPEHELTPKSTSSFNESDECKDLPTDIQKPQTEPTPSQDNHTTPVAVQNAGKSPQQQHEVPNESQDIEMKTLPPQEKTQLVCDDKAGEALKDIKETDQHVKHDLQSNVNESILTSTTTTSSVPIPETMLSPPKSEIQTDETNTASSSSSTPNSNAPSPASETQMSPSASSIPSELPLEARQPAVYAVEQEEQKKHRESDKRKSNSKVKTNGTMTSKSSPGKPLIAAITKKSAKAAAKPAKVRKPKSSLVTTMYESEISDKKGGIKLCIKKSDTSIEPPKVNSSFTLSSSQTPAAKAAGSALGAVAKVHRKRSRKSKTRPQLDSDDSEYEPKKKTTEKQKKQISFSASVVEKDPDARPEIEDQSNWAFKMPEEVLYKIFQMVCDRDGCLPTLIKLGRVCSLWRRVSLFPKLWKSMDLNAWIKEKYRTEAKLKWFIDNRCSHCTELNLANWKVTSVSTFLSSLAKGCPRLEGITLSGWKTFNNDHLTYLVDNLPKLERLDLSSVNVDMNASKSAVGLTSICNALQTMNGRLTHLYLAHNRLAGIPQIVTVLASHCPNLVSLDLSNVTTQATSHGILHIEKLQHGCQKLRVLRVTNSHITLSTATMQEQMDSPGFPELEELSVAALTHESRIICDEHLQRILKTSSKLKLLDVRGCMRLTHESLIRLPAWDIKHLFLSGCSITRDVGSGLELIASKWAHSLIELDLAWANVQQSLDNALRALAEKGAESPLAHLNLCGSSVSEEAVKEILANCPHMSSINLASCRGLPRGVKRLMKSNELQELRDILKVQMKVKLFNDNKSTKTQKSNDDHHDNDDDHEDDNRPDDQQQQLNQNQSKSISLNKTNSNEL